MCPFQWNIAVDQLDIRDLSHLRLPSALLHEANRHDQVSQGLGEEVSWAEEQYLL